MAPAHKTFALPVDKVKILFFFPKKKKKKEKMKSP